MANSTDPFAETVHGTNPQYLIEKITRLKIYNCIYWKEQCFGLTAETIIDKAIALKYCGGNYGGNIKPTNFLALILKMLQLQPEKEIIIEYIRNEDFKYLRALGAFYMRLVGRAIDVYNYLEPLYNDYRKLAYRGLNGWKVIYMDEFIDSLLHDEIVCDIALPHLQKRSKLEELGQIGPRQSALDMEIDGNDGSEEEDDDDDEMDPEVHNRLLQILASNGGGSNAAQGGLPPATSSSAIAAVSVETSYAKESNQNRSKEDKRHDEHDRVTQSRGARTTEDKEEGEIRGEQKSSRSDDRVRNGTEKHSASERGSRREDERNSRTHTRSHSTERRDDRDGRRREKHDDRYDRDRGRDERRYYRSRDRSLQREGRSRYRSDRRSRSPSYHRRDRRSDSRDRRQDRAGYRRREDTRERYRRDSRSRSKDRKRTSRRSPSRSTSSRSRSRSSSSSSSSSSDSSSTRTSRSEDIGRQGRPASSDKDRVKAKDLSQSQIPIDEVSVTPDEEALFAVDSKPKAKSKLSNEKKFDKMFKKSSSAATASSSATSSAAPAVVQYEEGSVEYWNQKREALGLKKLRV